MEVRLRNDDGPIHLELDGPPEPLPEGCPVTKVSPSQIKKANPELYGGCQRRWFIYKILRLQEPTGEAARYGSAVHDDIEKYLKGEIEEVTYPESQMAIDNYSVDADRIVGIEFNILKLDLRIRNVKLNGIIDLVYLTESGTPVIRDWKTRSKSSYSSAPNNSKIGRDLQMLIYAWAGFHIFDCTTLIIEHINLRRKDAGGLAHKRAFSQVGKEYVRTRLEQLAAPVIEDLIEISMWDLEHIPPNNSSCYAYNQRCGYYDPNPAQGFGGCQKIPFASVKHIDYNSQPITTPYEHTEASMDLDELLGDTAEPTETVAPEPSAPVTNDDDFDLDDLLGGTEPEPEPVREMTVVERAIEIYKEDPGSKELRSLIQNDMDHDDKLAFSKWRKEYKNSEVLQEDTAVDEPPQKDEDKPLDVLDIGGRSQNPLEEGRGGNAKLLTIGDLVDFLVGCDIPGAHEKLGRYDGIGAKGQKEITDALIERGFWSPMHEAVSEPVEEEPEKPATDTSAPIEPEVGDSNPEVAPVKEDEPVVAVSASKGLMLVVSAGVSDSDLVVDLMEDCSDLLDEVCENMAVRYWNENQYGNGAKVLASLLVRESIDGRFNGKVVWLSERTPNVEVLVDALRPFFTVVAY